METAERIRNLRKAKGYTLDHFAKLTGLSKGYLSKVERAKDPPPFSTLETIATALEEDVTVFIANEVKVDPPHNLDLVKKREAPDFIKAEGGYDYRALVSSFKNKYMAPFLMEVAKGTTRQLKHDGEEFVYVVAGELELQYEGEVHELEAGDSFYLDSRIAHRFKNNSDRKAVMLAVHFAYRRF